MSLPDHPVCGYWTRGMWRPCRNRVSEWGETCHLESHDEALCAVDVGPPMGEGPTQDPDAREEFDQAVMETLMMLRGRVPERQLSNVLDAFAELYPDSDRLREVFGEEATR